MIGLEPLSSLPPTLMLGVAPNPIAGPAVIHLSVPRAMDLRVRLYDVAGRFVRELATGRMTAGEHTLPLTLRRLDRSALSPGVYFVRAVGMGFRVSSKVVIGN